MYLLIQSITSNTIPFIPLIGLYLQFHLFYLNTKNYWWYIEIVNVHLVVLLQKSLRTGGLGDINPVQGMLMDTLSRC